MWIQFDSQTAVNTENLSEIVVEGGYKDGYGIYARKEKDFCGRIYCLGKYDTEVHVQSAFRRILSSIGEREDFIVMPLRGRTDLHSYEIEGQI